MYLTFIFINNWEKTITIFKGEIEKFKDNLFKSIIEALDNADTDSN